MHGSSQGTPRARARHGGHGVAHSVGKLHTRRTGIEAGDVAPLAQSVRGALSIVLPSCAADIWLAARQAGDRADAYAAASHASGYFRSYFARLLRFTNSKHDAGRKGGAASP